MQHAARSTQHEPTYPTGAYLSTQHAARAHLAHLSLPEHAYAYLSTPHLTPT